MLIRILINLLIIIEGFFLLFLVPPFQKADEYGHYWRMIGVKEGYFFCSDDNIQYINKKYIDFKDYFRVEQHVFKPTTSFPTSLIFNFSSFFNLNKSEFKTKIGLCQNSPFGYIFNIVGFLLGDFFNLNLLFQFYLARLFPFIVFLILFNFFYSFLKEKYLKFYFLFFSTIPMIIHQITAISLDSALFIFLYVALFTFLILNSQNNKLSKRVRIFFYFLNLISLFFVSFIKPIYFPLMLISILIYFSFKAFIFILIASFLIIFQVNQYLNYPLNPILFSLEAQKKIVFEDPIFFIESIINLIKDNQILISNIYGIFGVFGWTDSSISYFFVILYLLLFFFLSYKIKLRLSPIKFLFLFLICITTVILVLYGTYLGATTVGERIVLGLQGRYFLPVFPFILLSAKFLRVKLIYYFLFMVIIILNIFDVLKFRYFNRTVALKYEDSKCAMQKITSNNFLELKNEIEFNLINRKNDKIIGICLFIKSKKSNSGYITYKISVFNQNNDLIERFYLRLLGEFDGKNEFKFKKPYNLRKIKVSISPFFKNKNESYIKINKDIFGDLIYSF